MNQIAVHRKSRPSAKSTSDTPSTTMMSANTGKPLKAVLTSTTPQMIAATDSARNSIAGTSSTAMAQIVSGIASRI